MTNASDIYQSMRSKTHIGQLFANQRYLLLMISLASLLLLYPYLMTADGRATAMLLVLSTLVLLAGIYAVARSVWQWLVGLGLLVPALLGNWLGIEHTATAIGFILMSAESAFYAFAIVLLLAFVFDERGLLVDKLYCVLSAYILIGQLFFSLFVMLETFDPGSVQASDGSTIHWYDLMFFSYVTLTTLGYGDITPVSVPAQSLASLEAIAGLLYVAVMVAWLVSALKAPKVKYH